MDMKLSENTLAVLKNFSTINPGILFRQGNVLKTMSKAQNILAEAKIEDSFSEDFGIYDLNKFLGVMSALDNPDININIENQSLELGSSDNGCRYRMSDPALIVSPDQEIEVGAPEVSFTLPANVLEKVYRLGGVLGLPNIVFRGNRDKISIAALDVRNPDSDVYWIDVGETSAEFVSVFSYDSFKIIPNTYDVSITMGELTHFKNSDKMSTGFDIQYWIAMETGSTYSE